MKNSFPCITSNNCPTFQRPRGSWPLHFVYNCVHFTAANLLFTMNNAEQKGRGLFLVVVMELEGR